MAKNLVVGVDVGGTKILSCVIELGDKFKILSRVKKKTKPELGLEGVLERINQTITESIQESKINKKQIKAIGMGFPGTVDQAKGEVLMAANLGWKNFLLRPVLEKAFKIPVLVINDVNAGTYGEQQYGAARGFRDVAGVFWGTGVGGGLVIDGRVIEGAWHSAGEIGHICLNPDGPRCSCGNNGCLEAYTGKAALSNLIYQEMKNGRPCSLEFSEENEQVTLKSSLISSAYLAGDPLVKEVVHQATRYLGVGMANIVNLLNPQCLVLGGGMIESMHKTLAPMIDEHMRRHLFPSTNVELRIAGLGDYAVVIGAGVLALAEGK